MREIGPHSRPNVLAKLDGRRREARLMQSFRNELTDQMGGKPDAAQRALIDRACWLHLHVSLFDAKLVEDDGTPLSERDGREYLAWSNALTRILSKIGHGKPLPKQRQSIRDRLLAKQDAA